MEDLIKFGERLKALDEGLRALEKRVGFLNDKATRLK